MLASFDFIDIVHFKCTLDPRVGVGPMLWQRKPPMPLASEVSDSNQSMTNVYNLLREACGISQTEAAEFVHRTRLDSVKSWCSDRRTAPQGVINDLRKLAREIQNAGANYAELLKRTNEDNLYII